MAVQALSFLTQQRLLHDVTAYADQAERQATGSWLDDGGDRLAHPSGSCPCTTTPTHRRREAAMCKECGCEKTSTPATPTDAS